MIHRIDFRHFMTCFHVEVGELKQVTDTHILFIAPPW